MHKNKKYTNKIQNIQKCTYTQIQKCTTYKHTQMHTNIQIPKQSFQNLQKCTYTHIHKQINKIQKCTKQIRNIQNAHIQKYTQMHKIQKYTNTIQNTQKCTYTEVHKNAQNTKIQKSKCTKMHTYKIHKNAL